METHDTPLIPSTRPLQPGVVLTLEPGLYFNTDSSASTNTSNKYKQHHHTHIEVPKYLRGIGVRIEDDIIVGSDGKAEVITLGVKRDLSVR